MPKAVDFSEKNIANFGLITNVTDDAFNQCFSDDELVYSPHELDLIKNTNDEYIQSPDEQEQDDEQKSLDGSEHDLSKDKTETVDSASHSVMSNEEHSSNHDQNTSSAASIQAVAGH